MSAAIGKKRGTLSGRERVRRMFAAGLDTMDIAAQLQVPEWIIYKMLLALRGGGGQA